MFKLSNLFEDSGTHTVCRVARIVVQHFLLIHDILLGRHNTTRWIFLFVDTCSMLHVILTWPYG